MLLGPSAMKPRLSSLLCRSIARPQPHRRLRLFGPSTLPHSLRATPSLVKCSLISTSNSVKVNTYAEASYSQPAEKLNHDVTQEEKDHYKRQVEVNKEKQIRTPWHRDGADEAPAAEKKSSSNTLTKGKLLTTPSRMLKLILPLPAHDQSDQGPDAEPLALLVHPQQPLSYLERLIQAELPTIKDGDKDRIPQVYFRAEDSTQNTAEKKRKKETNHDEKDLEDADSMKIDGEIVRTGKLNRRTKQEAAKLRGGPGEGGVESYSGLGQDAEVSKDHDPSKVKFVRWSGSTDIGDFIRDAARGREFSIEIEGAPYDIRVGVPSFNDRTHYLRMRLRSVSRKISDMADVKKECDQIAHKGAQRVAMAGLGVLCGWWYIVYRLTFETELGWEVMEPVTYLVGLTSLMGGYIWFLYHNREVSYRSALNITISRRQSKLYATRGFDMDRWQSLIEDGNALRKEIRAVANEYDVEWDEREDEFIDEKVTEALREERKKAKKNGKDDDDDDSDDSKS